MKILILIYLLTKCAFKFKLTWLDIWLARALCVSYLPDYVEIKFPIDEANAIFELPDWLLEIANMEQETELPEAWGIFQDELADRFQEVLR